MFKSRYVSVLKALFVSSLTIGIMYSGAALAMQCKPIVRASDGCTDQGLLDPKTRRLFTPACVEHDRCYKSIGGDRTSCDNALIGAINQVCHNNFGKRLLGHGDPDFVHCDVQAYAMRGFFRENFNGIPARAFAIEQEKALSYSIPNATDNCDITQPGDTVARLSTRGSDVYGGPESTMVKALSGYTPLTGVPQSPTVAQTSAIISNYSVNGNSKEGRVTCETTTQVVGTRTWCERDSPWSCRTRSEPIYGPVELCKDYDWQNEFIRDIQMGLNVWNGEYSGLIPVVVVPPANYSINSSLVLLDIPADKVGVTTVLQTNVANPDNAILEYAVDNLPIWAEFDAINGSISTKPNRPTTQDVMGSPYAGVIVRVKDVANTEWRSIGPFSFNVVANANLQPNAVISSRRVAKIAKPANFSAELSTDADGDALTYEWTFTQRDGNVISYPASPNNIMVSPVFTVKGRVTVELRVDDGTGSANSVGLSKKTIWAFVGRRRR